MSQSEILRFVKETLGAVVARDDVEGHHHLIHDLGLDSIDVLDVLQHIEDELGVVVATDVLPRLRSVDDLVGLLHQRMHA